MCPQRTHCEFSKNATCLHAEQVKIFMVLAFPFLVLRSGHEGAARARTTGNVRDAGVVADAIVAIVQLVLLVGAVVGVRFALAGAAADIVAAVETGRVTLTDVVTTELVFYRATANSDQAEQSE